MDREVQKKQNRLSDHLRYTVQDHSSPRDDMFIEISKRFIVDSSGVKQRS